MQQKTHIKKGDKVKVIAGNSKGSEGKVLSVNRTSLTATVEGVNMATKHSKPTSENPQGGIVQVEAPVNISNLMLIDPKTGEPTRIGRKKDKDGKLVRYSKRTGDIIKS